MSYHDALNYLAQQTSVMELYDQLGGRVAICPEWNGKIMTSTCDGLDGDSFGCINVHAIDTESFDDFGGEDQWSISPLIHSFAVENIQANQAVLKRPLQVADANGVPVELALSRTISLLSRKKIGLLFGDAVADSLEQEDVSAVGFRTENTVQSQEQTCVASRLRGMFNASPNTVIILAVPPEDFETGQTSVLIDYLGSSPHCRIRYLSQTMLIRADGRKPCQITVPFPDSPPMIGAFELRFGTLTLWTFDLPNDSEDHDVLRIYNYGHPHIGEELDWAAYYETNCFSAPQELQPDNSLTYHQCTLHLNAENHVLGDLVQQIFGVSLEDVSRKMLR